MTRIQFKVYDETGRRFAVHDVSVPVTVEAATKYVQDECHRLREIPYPALRNPGKIPVATAVDTDSVGRFTVEHHHSPSGHSPGTTS